MSKVNEIKEDKVNKWTCLEHEWVVEIVVPMPTHNASQGGRTTGCAL